VKPNRELPPDTIQGLTGRYACKTIASVDIHLCQIAQRMVACEKPSEMAELLADRDRLLEVRLELQRARTGRVPMPQLSDTA